MSDDLVERAARALMRAEPWSSFWGKADAEQLARAALAVALEEAAKVCERRFMGDHNREDMEARRCAAAIRALIPKENF